MDKIIEKIEKMLPQGAREWSERIYMVAFSVCLVFLGLRNTTLNLPLQFKGSMILLCAIMGMVMVMQWLTHIRDIRRVAAAVLLMFAYGVILVANRHGFNRFNKLTILILVAAGAFGIHYRKLLKQWVYSIGAVLLITFSSAFIGAAENLVYYVGGIRLKMRGSMGVLYPTDAATWLFFFLMISWAAFDTLPDTVMLLIAVISLLFTKGYCDSKCCLVCTFLFILVILYRIFEKNIIEKKALLGPVKKIIDLLALFSVPIGALSIYILTVSYGKEKPLLYKIDKKLHYRLKYGWKGLKEYGIKLFGSDFEMTGNGGSYVSPGDNYTFLDSSYINILIFFGIITGIILLVMWIYVMGRAIGLNERRILLVMAVIAVHSFEEHHFAEIIYNPFIMLAFCSFLPEEREDRKTEGSGIRGLFKDARLITAMLGGALFIAISPVLLDIFRTIADILDAKNSLPGLITVLVFLMVFFAAVGLCIYSVIKQKTYALLTGVCTMLFLTTAASAFVSIKRNVYEDRLEADREAIELIMDNKTYPVYVNDYPYPYLTEYEGFSYSPWTDGDMARYKHGTMLFDSSEESHCSIKRGYMYAQVSPYTGIYSNDREVIEALTENDYHVTGYYSGERGIEIKDGELKNTTILPGKYLVRAELASDAAGKDITLNLINTDEEKAVATVDVGAEDYDDNGIAEKEMIMNLKYGVRELGYEILPENAEASLKSLSYVAKPDMDIHNYYNDIYQVIRKEYYDTEGKRITADDGESAVEYEYDDRRNIAVTRYYGIDNNPVIIKKGYAEIHSEYDDLHHVTAKRFYGTDGKPIALKDGQASEKITVDQKGNILGWKYFDTAGEPVMISQGYAELVREFDEENRVIREEYRDIYGKPVIAKKGYASYTAEYDENDNATDLFFYDTDRNLIIVDEGYAGIHREFDEKGNIIEESYYGIDGKLVMLANGYAMVRRAYDALKRITSESYFDTEEKPVELASGQASDERVYNQNGRIISRIFYGTEGKRKVTKKGYAEIRLDYNALGQIIREEYYGEDEKPIVMPNGFAAVETEYDRYSKPCVVRYFGTDGKPVSIKAGYSEIHRDYNEQGQIIKESYFGTDGKSVALSSGQAADERAYDRDGNLVEQKFYGVSGNRVIINSGYSRIDRRFNKKKQVIGESYFGMDDEPIALPTGQASDTRELDDMGNVVFQKYYDISGNAVILKKGYAGIRREFDEKKRVTYEEFYGTEDEKIMLPNGYSALSREFDEAGNPVSLKFYDLDGNPVLTVPGYFELRRLFDDKKRVVCEGYFGFKGEAVNNIYGISQILTVYGPDGKATETMYNINGEKVEPKKK